MENQLTIYDAIATHKEIDAMLEEKEECPYGECDGSGVVTIQTAPDDEHTRQCRCAIKEDEGDEEINLSFLEN